MYIFSFAAVERTQQRKLEELLLAAAREGKTAELIALVKKKNTISLPFRKIFIINFIIQYNCRTKILKIIIIGRKCLDI